MVNRTVLIVGGVISGISLLLALAGGMMASRAGEDLETSATAGDFWEARGATNGTITYFDEDGNGELGFYFYIDVESVDEDANGAADACERFSENHTVTVVRDGANSSENLFEFNCRIPPPGEEDQNIEDGMTRIGWACGFENDMKCENGDYTWNSSAPVSVMYIDKALALLFGGIGGLAGGGLIGMCGCCGILIGIIVLIVGLVMDPSAASAIHMQTTMMQQGQMGMMAAPIVPVAPAVAAAPIAPIAPVAQIGMDEMVTMPVPMAEDSVVPLGDEDNLQG